MTSDDEIRRKAEAIVANNPDLDADTEAAAADTTALIHELRVHQIELEFQNDELRRAHSALEAQQAEYLDLYENAPIGYFSLDSAAVIVRANSTFSTMLRRSPDELIGRQLSEFIAQHMRDSFLRRFRALFRDPSGRSLDVEFGPIAGVEIVLHLTARRSSPTATEIRFAAADVTDRRHAERRIADLGRQKELLFRELRHRTSNNYQVVLSMLALQSDLHDDEHVRSALQQARSRIEAMLTVQESLTYSDADTLTELDTYFSTLTDRIVSALDPQGRVRVTKRFVAARADADTATSIGIILNELATNAWKHGFGADGAGMLCVWFERCEEGWCLGIDDEPAQGSRAGSGDAPQAGSGLGQTLIQAVTGQLGGSFNRRSTARGTACRLTLPERFATPR